MALKFLNKKGWHTGSLRNIENVWKAEQKHETEQKKLEELRKQIQEERERDEFRLLQEKAGILPRQERLEFLYDSGLAVGKGSNDGVVFKSLDSTVKESAAAPASSSAASASGASSSAVPGALFEEKSYSANDAWRKLHSDPLLMIRQREQEALARIKNNPVQMAMIRKSVAEKSKDKDRDKKEHKKHRHRSSKHKKRSPSPADSDYSLKEEQDRRKKNVHESTKHKKRSPSPPPACYDLSDEERYKRRKNVHESTKSHDRYREDRSHYDASRHERGNRSFNEDSRQKSEVGARLESHYKHGKPAPKLTEEERAARLREMQLDAEVHEEQRWKRLKKAADNDAREATRDAISRGRNFLDAAHKSVYGAEKGGSATIEESVRRRTHYSQGSRGGEGNAFRRQ